MCVVYTVTVRRRKQKIGYKNNKTKSVLGHSHLSSVYGTQIRFQTAALCHAHYNKCQHVGNLTVLAGVVQTGAGVVVCRCSGVPLLLVRV